jgi:hypothetical protein
LKTIAFTVQGGDGAGRGDGGVSRESGPTIGCPHPFGHGAGDAGGPTMLIASPFAGRVAAPVTVTLVLIDDQPYAFRTVRVTG